ncbi:DUF498-domain-containing protein [Mycena leptocephala]|nr:DUF498-domain-containing protein [Mycena leptocephala]
MSLLRLSHSRSASPRLLARPVAQKNALSPTVTSTRLRCPRAIHTSAPQFIASSLPSRSPGSRSPPPRTSTSAGAGGSSGLTNILASGTPPPIQIASVSEGGIVLEDGLLLPSACIFLEGKVFLWDVPGSVTQWGREHLGVFEVVVPRPEILLLGTGTEMAHPPPSVRTFLAGLGIQVDVMSTRNACSTYNLLAEEGRRVAAALAPLVPRRWQKGGNVEVR